MQSISLDPSAVMTLTYIDMHYLYFFFLLLQEFLPQLEDTGGTKGKHLNSVLSYYISEFTGFFLMVYNA